MAVYLETNAVSSARCLMARAPAPLTAASAAKYPCLPLRIGLVNNMPDAALTAAERQFINLLNAASGPLPIHLSLYALPGVPRQPRAAKYLREFYASTEKLAQETLDGLIVTGAEPVTSRLDDEPYWPALARLVQWAQDNTSSAIWSCLAAHAAVLQLDGAERRRAEAKHFGVFDCTRLMDHCLVQDLPSRFAVPHSRWNGLDEDEMLACGYRVLTRGDQIGVDTFVKQYKSLFVFFQGHPEYEADSLLREYRRDAVRYLARETEGSPQVPKNYFDRNTAELLALLGREAAITRSEEVFMRVSAVLSQVSLSATWQSTTCILYRNWLNYLQRRQRQSLPLKTTFLDQTALKEKPFAMVPMPRAKVV